MPVRGTRAGARGGVTPPPTMSVGNFEKNLMPVGTFGMLITFFRFFLSIFLSLLIICYTLSTPKKISRAVPEGPPGEAMVGSRRKCFH